WVKSFLQVQSALAMRPFVFDVRPVDLLTLIAFFQDNKPPSPPHGLRYELRPEAPIAAVLEPWEQRITFRGTRYTGYERTVRLWGRRRLELLQGVLPYADRVSVGVLGRGLPHVYVCHCGPYQFTFVLSGWTKSDWSKDAAFDLLAPRTALDPQQVERVHSYLGEHLMAPLKEIAADTGMPANEVEQALFSLCRAGRVMVDPTIGQYRLRELFAEPLDLDALFAPDPRLAEAQQFVEAGRVTLRSVSAPGPDASWRRETRVEAAVTEGGATYEVSVRVDDTGRVRFGRCQCPFFERNLMSRGPCAHIMAARLALDAATATPAGAPTR
ncbi:MAG TPA: SWIM zinc finger family protein, partial [Ktedonobacterales bacterium]|nr:SWIM zinc finger family protein [Ktedonobacterales bacterium]